LLKLSFILAGTLQKTTAIYRLVLLKKTKVVIYVVFSTIKLTTQ